MKLTKPILLLIFVSTSILFLLSTFPDRIIVEGNQHFLDDLFLKRGLISPGNSPGLISVNGNFSMSADANYKCELSDLSGPGLGHDQIQVTGNVDLEGTLDIILDGYSPDDNDFFEIITFSGSLNGVFTSISGLPVGWQIDYGILNANAITIYGPGATLPVELLTFTGIESSGKIELFWSTASELNSDYFEVEHSIDGKVFFNLSQIPAQGYSSNIKNYSFIHNNPSNGINYYRLRQADNDGSFSFSPIIAVKTQGSTFSFFPNPTKNEIFFLKPIQTVILYDLLGNEILRNDDVRSSLILNDLAKGIYIIDFNNGSSREKLVIE